MAILKNEYKSFLDDIEKNIKNKEDLEYVKERFTKFVDSVIEQMDNILDYKKDEIERLEDAQKLMNEKMEKMEQIIDNIEKDIYAEDGFDFEIICPYCNYEFVIDVDENKSEVQCPECNNIIELDWGEENEENKGCSGNCKGCTHHNEEDEDM